MAHTKMVLSVVQIDENTRDVAFEGKILSRYGTFDYIRANRTKDRGYAYLHCDMIDKECLTTIMLSVCTPLIEHHQAKLHPGSYVRVENFAVKPKSGGGFQKGDMPCVIFVQSTTRIIVLPLFVPEFLPIFHTKDSIKDVRK